MTIEGNNYLANKSSEPIPKNIESGLSHFVVSLKILDDPIDIYAPFWLSQEVLDLVDRDILESSITNESGSEYSVVFQEDQDTYLEWLPEAKKAVLHGLSKEFEKHPSINFYCITC